MKKTIFILVLAALFGGCQNEELMPPEAGGGEEIRLVIPDFPAFTTDDPATRATWDSDGRNARWDEGDLLHFGVYFYNDGGQRISLTVRTAIYSSGTWVMDKPIVVPEGAAEIYIPAYHADRATDAWILYSNTDAEVSDIVGGTLALEAFRHQGSRITFTGLAEGDLVSFESANDGRWRKWLVNVTETGVSGAGDDIPVAIAGADGTLTIYADAGSVTESAPLRFRINGEPAGERNWYVFDPGTPNADGNYHGRAYTIDCEGLAGGDGMTPDDAVIIPNTDDTHYIYDEAGLRAFRYAVQNFNPALNGVQMADITLTGEWEPIDSSSTPYAGTYNGRGYSIAGLTITNPWSFAGLFGAINSDAVLVDIHLTDVNINNTHTSTANTGALAARNDGGTIALCSSAGSVSGGAYVGGLVGFNMGGGHITRSWSSANVHATYVPAVGGSSYAGGLVAVNYNGVIAACRATGTVSAAAPNGGGVITGGFVGWNSSSGYIYFSYAEGTVMPPAGVTTTGGFAGLSGGDIRHCYTTQPTFANGANGMPGATWSSGNGGTPKSVVRFPGNISPNIRTWKNGAVATVEFVSNDVWTNVDYPKINIDYSGQ